MGETVFDYSPVTLASLLLWPIAPISWCSQEEMIPYPLKWIPLSVAQTCACMLSHSGFSRQEYWSGLPFSPPGNLPDSGIKPKSPETPALAGGLFTTWATWEAHGSGHPQPSSKQCVKNLPRSSFPSSEVQNLTRKKK